MKKYDSCIDGKYGPEEKIKCKKATKFRKGNAQTFVADGSEINSPPNYYKHDFSGSVKVNLSGFESNRYRSNSYNVACNRSSCNYDFDNMQKEYITNDSVKQCRGDYKYKNIVCKDSSGNTIDTTEDIKNKCSGITVGSEIQGNKNCSINNSTIVHFQKGEDTGNTTSTIDTTLTCNANNREYYINKKCVDSSGNTVADTYLNNTINGVDSFDCWIDNKTKNVKIETKSINNPKCECKCERDGYEVGPRTNYSSDDAINCTVDGGNYCSTCDTSKGFKKYPVNGQCVCKDRDNSNQNQYYFKNGKCARDCKAASYNVGTCDKSTGIYTQTPKTYHNRAENGGLSCPNKVSTCKVDCDWEFLYDWKLSPDNEQYIGVDASLNHIYKDHQSSPYRSLFKYLNPKDRTRYVKGYKTYKVNYYPRNGGSSCPSFINSSNRIGNTNRYKSEPTYRWVNKDDVTMSNLVRNKTCFVPAKASITWGPNNYNSEYKKTNKTGIKKHCAKHNTWGDICHYAYKKYNNNNNDHGRIFKDRRSCANGRCGTSGGYRGITYGQGNSLPWSYYGWANEYALNFPKMKWTECPEWVEY